MTKEIFVPETASEIPMERYQKYMSLSDEQRYNFVTLFSCLTGCTEDEARQVKASDVARSINALIRALNDTNVPRIEKYTHDGVTYGLEPQLDEISFALLADLATAFEDPATWHKALAILYRPVIREHKGTYTIEAYSATTEGYKQRQSMFSTAPASLFISVRAFFFTGSKALSLFTQVSLLPAMERKPRKIGRKLRR